MKPNRKWIALLLSGAMALSLLAGCAGNDAPSGSQSDDVSEPDSSTAAPATDVLSIAEQGMFSSGGTVTEPVSGDYDATTNWLDAARPGNTAHVGHANVLYQRPAVWAG